jgi:hypothetical protein
MKGEAPDPDIDNQYQLAEGVIVGLVDPTVEQAIKFDEAFASDKITNGFDRYIAAVQSCTKVIEGKPVWKKAVLPLIYKVYDDFFSFCIRTPS